MLCVVCQTATVERPQVCAHDRSRIPGILRDLGQAYAALLAEPESAEPGLLVIDDGSFDAPYTFDVVPLPAGPTRATAGSAPVSGSREAPVPVSLDLVDLTAQARAGAVHDSGWRGRRDQVGLHSVATVLDQWARDWIDTLPNVGEHLPAPTVPNLLDWLDKRLDTACDHHRAVDEFAREMSELLWTCRRLAGTIDAQPEYCDGVACSYCDRKALHRQPGSPYRAYCGVCGKLYTDKEYEQWVGMVAAQVKPHKAVT
jgi:hypothetical protein